MKLILTGNDAGKTKVINGCLFKDGVLFRPGPPSDHGVLANYMTSFYGCQLVADDAAPVAPPPATLPDPDPTSVEPPANPTPEEPTDGQRELQDELSGSGAADGGPVGQGPAAQEAAEGVASGEAAGAAGIEGLRSKRTRR